MKSSALRIIIVCVFIFAGSSLCLAQGEGNSGGSGGTGGSGSNSSGGSGSSAPLDTGVNNETTAVEGTQDTPAFQGFQNLGNSSFVGVPGSQTFIGYQQTFEASKSTSSRRTTASTTRRTTSSRATSSRATTSRMSSNRMSTGRTGTSSTGNRQVRSTASADFDHSSFELNNRASQFQERLSHLPNLRGIPQNVEFQWTNTSEGTVAKMTGTVASAKDKKLAEMLLLLEPGVDRVQNDLVVKPTP